VVNHNIFSYKILNFYPELSLNLFKKDPDPRGQLVADPQDQDPPRNIAKTSYFFLLLDNNYLLWILKSSFADPHPDPDL
jgi:hypothetical protein